MCLWMCVHMCVFLYVYMLCEHDVYLCVHTCVCLCVCAYVSVCVCLSVCTHACTQTYKCMCLWVICYQSNIENFENKLNISLLLCHLIHFRILWKVLTLCGLEISIHSELWCSCDFDVSCLWVHFCVAVLLNAL